MNAGVQKVQFPGIAEMNARADSYRRQGRSLINLGQAIPFFNPPPNALQRLTSTLLEDQAIHRYSLDPGWLPLRQRWCRRLESEFGLRVDPDHEILITAGANSAYLMAIMALVNPGDKVGLPTPWYFNHQMAVAMTGAIPVPVPLSAAAGFQPDPDELLRLVRAENVRVLTLVSPNNPTGATYEPARLRAISEGCRQAGVTLISDETYALFPGPGERHIAVGASEEHPEHVVTIGSFSKAFGMTGWRVGYLIASRALIQELVKVQDTMFICASHPGQRLVCECLDLADDWLEQQRRELRRRTTLVREAYARLGPWVLRSSGLYFAWYDGPASGRETAFRLLDEAGVITIPGDVFGPDWEHSLRVSIGGCPAADLEQGLKLMASRFTGA